MTISLQSDVGCSNRRTYSLNEMDCAFLWQVERNTLPSTARSSGPTPHLIASQIRGLEKRNLAQTMALININESGQDLAHFSIRVTDRPIFDVARDVSRLCSTLVVVSLDNHCRLMATARISNENSAHQVLEELSAIPGISTVCSELVLRQIVNHISHIRLKDDPEANPVSESSTELSGSVAKGMDELDLGIIDRLQRDRRMSNRRVAEELGVTEGAIRYRIKKLEENNLLKFVLNFDPKILGLSHWAWLKLEVHPSMQNDVISALQNCCWTKYLAVTTGAKSLACLALTKSKSELDAIINNEVKTIPGVQGLSVSKINGSYKLDKRWGSF